MQAQVVERKGQHRRRRVVAGKEKHHQLVAHRFALDAVARHDLKQAALLFVFVGRANIDDMIAVLCMRCFVSRLFCFLILLLLLLFRLFRLFLLLLIDGVVNQLCRGRASSRARRAPRAPRLTFQDRLGAFKLPLHWQRQPHKDAIDKAKVLRMRKRRQRNSEHTHTQRDH